MKLLTTLAICFIYLYADIDTSTPIPKYCNSIKYLNASGTKLSFNTYSSGNTDINNNQKKTEFGINSNSRIIKGFCKKIANTKNLKFGFKYDASLRQCICKYGGKR